MEIVLVYLGKVKLPKYVLVNIKYLKETFPKNKITFISDNIMNLDIVKLLGVNTFHCSDFYRTAPEEYLESAPDLKFRGGFWFLTFARFFAINEYCERFKLNSLLHLESDVLLMKSFPFDKISELNGLAFPLVNSGYAAASTLFIKDHLSISTLCEFIKEQILVNPKTTDMDILGSPDLAKRVEITYLPIAFGGACHFEYWVSKEDHKSLCTDVQYFGGIFDGMTWGQYLTGEDPRNHYGIRKLYRNQIHHSVLINSYEIFFVNNRLYVKNEYQTFEIYSLHIHSKDKRLFKYENDYKFLNQRILDSYSGERFEIVWTLAIKFFPLRVKNSLKMFVKSILKSVKLYK